ncbi:MAG TPA: type IV toxin-antitoxin system AbiEi family antitoxin domain-containing protein [Acidimicrobiia bacterium]|nr:type IV toxin-antitoxin system AbiEi family antitoxin domain-containing protein [Acidimicrobiia bacterium]
MGDRYILDRYARRQYGVFNNRQLREAGYDRFVVARRVESGEWIRLCPNVFCLASAPPTWERQTAAAVLSRSRAYVAGRSAAYLLGLRDFRKGTPTVMVPAGSNSRLTIARVIRTRHFDVIATVRLAGFVVTSAAETLTTLARELSRADLANALEDALLAGKVRLEEFGPVLAREEASPWGGVMAEVVFEHSPDAPTWDSTYLEALVERLLRRGDLPPWVREFPFSIRGRPARVDVYIPVWRLVIEADGRAWHGRFVDQEADRRRDAELAAKGIQVIRLTYSMLTEEPDRCLEMILAAGRHRSAG